MDITNIPQNLIKALEQKNTEQLAILSRVLNLVLGKTVIANITSTAPVTPQEREALLKQTAAALAQINKQAINPANVTPAVKAEVARLLQQQNMLKSPELKWVNLLVNNRPLMTYSDRPLATGQAIPVQLQSPQKLVLLDLPEASPLNSPIDKATPATANSPALGTPAAANLMSKEALNELLKAALAELGNKATATATPTSNQSPSSATNPNPALAKAINALPENLAKALTTSTPIADKIATSTNEATATTAASKQLPANPSTVANTANYSAKDLALKFLTLPADKNPAVATSSENALGESMRTLLPYKDTANALLPAITQLQQLPAAARLQLVSPSVEQALKSLAAQIRSPLDLMQPKVVAQLVKNSGIFFESNLNKLVQGATNDPGKHSLQSSDLSRSFNQDTKGALLTLLSRVNQELSNSKSFPNDPTLKLLQQLGSPAVFSPVATKEAPEAESDLPANLALFMQQLMNKPVKELSNKELRTQLLLLIQQHSLHSLAKIQLQQLHSLNQEQETKDSAAPTASWQLEIPVKHHNDIQHLHLRIDREWIEDKPDTNHNKSGGKIKQWSVTLRFDLPTLGEFCAQLAIVDSNVSATLWAARENTFAQVREQIDGLRKQLENEGINVKYLQCMRGMPPEKPMALSYSLIDVST